MKELSLKMSSMARAPTHGQTELSTKVIGNKESALVMEVAPTLTRVRTLDSSRMTRNMGVVSILSQMEVNMMANG